MRLLADENLHAGLVEWLRSNGHDVVYVAEMFGGEPDDVVLRRARDANRIVVTDDKDFGELVVRRRLSTAGVVSAQSIPNCSRADSDNRCLPQGGSQTRSTFTVATPGTTS